MANTSLTPEQFEIVAAIIMHNVLEISDDKMSIHDIMAATQLIISSMFMKEPEFMYKLSLSMGAQPNFVSDVLEQIHLVLD